jgi:hypothetical protein
MNPSSPYNMSGRTLLSVLSSQLSCSLSVLANLLFLTRTATAILAYFLVKLTCARSIGPATIILLNQYSFSIAALSHFLALA